MTNLLKFIAIFFLFSFALSEERKLKCGFDPVLNWIRAATIKIEILENNQLKLECEMHGSYETSVKWYHDGDPIQAHLTTKIISEYDVDKDYTNYSIKVEMIANTTDILHKSLFCVGQNEEVVCQVPFTLILDNNIPTVSKIN